jgi:hypothetical protein
MGNSHGMLSLVIGLLINLSFLILYGICSVCPLKPRKIPEKGKIHQIFRFSTRIISYGKTQKLFIHIHSYLIQITIKILIINSRDLINHTTMAQDISSDPIIQKLQVLRIFDEPIRFINTYQGMPINQPGRIIDSRMGTVKIKTSKAQLIALQDKKETYFEIDVTSAFYKAAIQSLNWQEETVELTDFKAVAVPLGLRSAVRISANDIPVYFTHAGRKKTVQARLIDLSLVGISLLYSKSAGRAHVPACEDTIEIRFELPVVIDEEETIQPVICSGTVAYFFQQTGSKDIRLGIRIKFDNTQEQIVNHFIIQREISLLKHIREISDQESISPFSA